jgi:hypothetical protein
LKADIFAEHSNLTGGSQLSGILGFLRDLFPPENTYEHCTFAMANFTAIESLIEMRKS